MKTFCRVGCLVRFRSLRLLFAGALGGGAGVTFAACGTPEPAKGTLGDTEAGASPNGGGSAGGGTTTGGDGGASGLRVDAGVDLSVTLPSTVVGMYAQADEDLVVTCADGLVRSVGSTGAVSTLGNAIPRAAGIVANSSQVYVVSATAVGATNGAIVRIDRGSGTETTLASSLLAPGPIAIDGSSIYWVDGGTGTGIRLVSLPLSDTSTTMQPIVLGTYSSFGTPTNLVLTGTGAYFSDHNGTEAEVLFVDLTKASAANYATRVASVAGTPAGLAFDSTSVYLLLGGSAGSLQSFPRTLDAGVTSTGTALVTGLNDPLALVTAGTQLAWVSSATGTLSVYGTLQGTSASVTSQTFPGAAATALGAAGLYVAYGTGSVAAVTF